MPNARAAYATMGLVCLLPPSGGSAQDADPKLLSYVESIRAIDDHAHVVAPAPGRDEDYDQLRCEELPPAVSLPPANFRFGPELQAAWKALYAFSGSPGSDEDLKGLDARKNAERGQRGNQYHDWVREQAGLDVVLANRVAMAPGLGSHFLWVPYVDALLVPLDNSAEKARNPDRRALFGMAEQLLGRYLHEVGLAAPPPTLDGYLDQVVLPTLARLKQQGAVALKFEVAYLRALDFQAPDRKAASAVYARGGVPGSADYKRLQDLLFHVIAAEAGRLGLAVHIHTGTGCGEYFDDAGADPLLLTPVLNDPELRQTRFVLLHGGMPNERHVASLILKPNVYADTSVLEFFFSPAELARVLRPWLEMMPERVLFGTDAGPFGPGADWEETTWLGSRNARRALALALTGMVKDGVIGEARAKQIADGVLRRNAAQLYHLEGKAE